MATKSTNLYLAFDAPACLACDGGWLLFDRPAAAADGHYLLKNPISKAATELPGSLSGLPATAGMKICKLVVMSRVLAAAIVSSSGGGGSRTVALCRPGTSLAWSPHHPPGADQLGHLRDIAVHGGRLYALHGHGNLSSYDLNDDDGAGEPKVSSCVHHIAGDALPPNKLSWEHDMEHYLLPSASGGELLLVRWLRRRHQGGEYFTVFEADMGGGRWSEATRSSLRDQLIFIGTGCSRALTASHYGGVGAMRGNCVFYTNDVEAYSSTHNFLVYDMIWQSNGPVFPIYDDDYLHRRRGDTNTTTSDTAPGDMYKRRRYLFKGQNSTFSLSAE